jgi:hypothetical protein
LFRNGKKLALFTQMQNIFKQLCQKLQKIKWRLLLKLQKVEQQLLSLHRACGKSSQRYFANEANNEPST